MRRILRAGALCVFLGLSLVLVWQWSAARSVRNIHRVASSIAVDDDFYRNLLLSYFETYRDDISVVVNGEYDGDLLNVVVFDGGVGIGGFPDLALNNFVAIGSNLILIDKRRLDLMLIVSSYGINGHVARVLFDLHGTFVADVMWSQQYTNIIRDARSGGTMFQSEVARVKRGITHPSFSQPPKEIEKIFGGPTGDFTMQFAAFNLGFIMEHEMAHLQIPFLERAGNRIQALLSFGKVSIDRLEEDDADRLAQEGIIRLMDRFRALSSVVAEPEDSLSVLYSTFIYLWVDGMFEFYEDLDVPIVAEDFLFEINFISCYLDSDLFDIIPDHVFAMMPSLATARLRPSPVFTESEAARLMSYFQLSKTHAHSASRAESILGILLNKFEENGFSERTDVESIGVSARLFNRVVGVDVGHVESLLRYSLSPLDLSKDRIMHIIPGIVEGSGYFCEMNSCEVIKSGGGRLEVVAQGVDVYEIRVSGFWRSLESDPLWVSLGEVISELADVNFLEIRRWVGEISEMCPGSFKIIPLGASGLLLYVNRGATNGYVSLRLLKPLM